MTAADQRIPETSRIASLAWALLLLAALPSCAAEPEQHGDAPFLLPSGAAAQEAPFLGPAQKLPPPVVEEEAPPADVGGPAEIAVSGPVPSPLPSLPATTESDRRREVWLRSYFRCKAISSTRLRRCRFEETAGGFELRFPMSDVVCANVSFDGNGDP
jgi:hypothetical protein